MRSNRFWLLVLGATVLLCAVCAALIPLFARPGAVAEIRQNGVLLRTVSLDKPQDFSIDAPNGGSNTVTVRDGRIRVSHASCPDQVCVNQDWVNRTATPIVCLPNGLVIQIKGGETDLDATTG